MRWREIFDRVSQEAGKAILSIYRSPAASRVMGRGRSGDITLWIDALAEQVIEETLKREVGEDFILISEESGEKRLGSHPRFIILCDPLDGSHNAWRGIPFFSISLALLDLEGRFKDVRFGYVKNLLTQDAFYAERGRGAYRNGDRLEPSALDLGIDTIAIESPSTPFLAKTASSLQGEGRKIRILGCASLSLCLVASGAFSSVVVGAPGGARSIDTAAAYFIAKEAGCIVTDDGGLDVGDVKVGIEEERKNIVASIDDEVHARVLEALRCPSSYG